MLRIRLSRVGKRNQPSYRLIVVDRQKDPWGKAVEIIGHFNPRSKERVLKTDRIKHWISKGAQPTDTVWNLLLDEKIVEGVKRHVTHITKKRRDAIAAAAPKQETPAA